MPLMYSTRTYHVQRCVHCAQGRQCRKVAHVAYRLERLHYIVPLCPVHSVGFEVPTEHLTITKYRLEKE